MWTNLIYELDLCIDNVSLYNLTNSISFQQIDRYRRETKKSAAFLGHRYFKNNVGNAVSINL